MDLLLFRHGIAQAHAPHGNDHARALTPDGIKRTTQAAQGLLRIAPNPRVILTSPKVRALQTADILAKVFDLKPVPLPALASSDLTPIFQALRRRDESTLLLVGHEPTLSQMISFLCCGQHDAALDLKKAGCALVSFQWVKGKSNPQGKLRWLATPRMLRRLRRG